MAESESGTAPPWARFRNLPTLVQIVAWIYLWPFILVLMALGRRSSGSATRPAVVAGLVVAIISSIVLVAAFGADDESSETPAASVEEANDGANGGSSSDQACALVAEYDDREWQLTTEDDVARSQLLAEASDAAGAANRHQLASDLATASRFWSTSTAGLEAPEIDRILIDLDRANARIGFDCRGEAKAPGPDDFASPEAEEEYLALLMLQDLVTPGSDQIAIGYSICDTYRSMADTPAVADEVVINTAMEVGLSRSQAMAYVLGAQIHLCPETLTE